jgi:hypothetical protein
MNRHSHVRYILTGWLIDVGVTAAKARDIFSRSTALFALATCLLLASIVTTAIAGNAYFNMLDDGESHRDNTEVVDRDNRDKPPTQRSFRVASRSYTSSYDGSFI